MTPSSLEVDTRTKQLVDALHPWPTSNEEAWGIVRHHLRRTRLDAYEAVRRHLEMGTPVEAVLDMLTEYEKLCDQEDGYGKVPAGSE